MIINVALLEDEKIEQERTLSLFSTFSKENNFEFQIDVFNTSEEIKSVNLDKYQLIMLDIILANEKTTGMDVAKFIREKNSKVGIVFITKTVYYAVQGYEVNALDYLVKPLVYEDLSLKLKQYIKTLSMHFDRLLTLKCTDRVLNINESKIYYFDVYSHYVYIHSEFGEFKIRSRISDIEKMVSDLFTRISRNYVINLRYVQEIRKNDVVVKGNLLKITDKYKRSFLDAFNYYLLKYEKQYN